jgi:hypothetical protein
LDAVPTPFGISLIARVVNQNPPDDLRASRKELRPVFATDPARSE